MLELVRLRGLSDAALASEFGGWECVFRFSMKPGSWGTMEAGRPAVNKLCQLEFGPLLDEVARRQKETPGFDMAPERDRLAALPLRDVAAEVSGFERLRAFMRSVTFPRLDEIGPDCAAWVEKRLAVYMGTVLLAAAEASGSAVVEMPPNVPLTLSMAAQMEEPPS